MKRYLLFAYPSYYPNGGAEDLIGDFETVEEMARLFKKEDGRVYLIADDYKVNYSIIDGMIGKTYVFNSSSFIDFATI